MNPLAAEYYAPLLQLPPEQASALVAPQLLYGPEDAGPLSVRRLEDRGFNHTMDQRLAAYTAPLATAVALQLQLRRQVPEGVSFKKGYYPGTLLFKELRATLVEPKIVTGQVLQLGIAALAPGELPGTVMDRLRHRTARPLPTQNPIDGFDVYYGVSARLRAGGRLSTLACAAHVAPVVYKSLRCKPAEGCPNGKIARGLSVVAFKACEAEAITPLLDSLVTETRS